MGCLVVLCFVLLTSAFLVTVVGMPVWAVIVVAFVILLVLGNIMDALG